MQRFIPEYAGLDGLSVQPTGLAKLGVSLVQAYYCLAPEIIVAITTVFNVPAKTEIVSLLSSYCVCIH